MATGTLTMSDIAALAQVKRPVVSVWRRRPTVTGELLPLPSAVDKRHGIEFCAAADVVEWLVSTGRGNNRSPIRGGESRLEAAGREGADVAELALASHVVLLRSGLVDPRIWHDLAR